MTSQELLERVQKYIKHSSAVYGSTHQVYRHNLQYAFIIEKITWCRNMLKGANEHSGIKHICRLVLTMKKALFDILPSPANKSYTTSLKEFNEIIDFCKSTIG
jgi:hypothetical protein